jgi:hypothetical protein
MALPHRCAVRGRAILGGGSVAIVAFLAAACGEPTRPFNPGPGGGGLDTAPPVIEFLSPSADTTVSAGSTVLVSVRVTDHSAIASVTATVSGSISFGFPTMHPLDTVLQAGFPIPTDASGIGTVYFSVLAIDILTQASEDTLSFVVQ